MKVLSAAALIFLLVEATKGDPFFGNNYIIPHASDIVRQSNAIVTSLNNAQTSVNPYLRSLPTSAPNLNSGALALTQYVGNVSRLIGNIYRQVSSAANDRTTTPAIIFLRINTAINESKPFLENSTILTSSFSLHFDSKGGTFNRTSNTAKYFQNWNKNLNESVLSLEQILQSLSDRIAQGQGQSLNTQQFLESLQNQGLLQSLIENIAEASVFTSDFASRVANLVSAITTSNSFRSQLNSRLATSRTQTNSLVDAYFTTSSTGYNTFIAATSRVLTHLQTVNETFAFRWPLIMNADVKKTFILLNQSIENIVSNIYYRQQNNILQQENVANSFKVNNYPFLSIEQDGEEITRRLLDIIEPDACVNSLYTNFLNSPNFVTSIIRQCFADQTNLERRGLDILTALSNNFLQTYITISYTNLNICFSYNFDRMNDCLDNIAVFTRFSSKFWLLDTTSYNLQEDLSHEIDMCMVRLINYVLNNGLEATCGK